MTKKSPFAVIKSRRVTEKSQMLGNLHSASSNRCLSKCKTPKVVFDVDPSANKQDIARAVEEIFADQKVKVLSVNTITVPTKMRRVRGFLGKTSGGKKAIVTLQAGTTIDKEV